MGKDFFKTYNQTADEFVDSLDSVTRILENSQCIYAIDTSSKKSELSKILRYEDLSVPQLSEQGSKIDKLIKCAVDNNIGVPVHNQEYLVNTKRYIDNKIVSMNDTHCAVRMNKLIDFNNSLRNTFVSLDKSYPFHYDETREDAERVITEMFSEEYINLEGIQYVVTSVIEGLIEENEIMSTLIDKVGNTIIESFTNRYTENYYNLPIVSGINLLYESMNDEYKDDYIKSSMLSSVFEKLISKISNTLIENGFNPNPFNIYNLCPFDAGVSNVTRTIYDIIDADTDEELTEALFHYSILDKICESVGDKIFYMNPDELVESVWFEDAVSEGSGGKIGAIARTAARKSSRFVNDKLHKAKSGAEHVAIAAGKVVDPMARFVLQADQKIREADHNERRKVIIQGGYSGKLIRWIKRAIAMVLASVAIPGGLGVIASAISLVGFIATDRNLDKLERNRILRELEDELKIVTEKIEDSRGDENKQKKYELMRIKANLEREIFRIKARLKKA